MTPLDAAITDKLLRTTAAYVKKLQEIGIRRVADLLRYFPRGYEDRSETRKLYDLVPGENNVARATVESVDAVRTGGGKLLVQAILTDDEGAVAQAVWFNQAHMKTLLHPGREYVFSGKVVLKYHRYSFQSPDAEPVGKEQVRTGRVVPVYPEVDTEKKHGLRLTSEWFTNKIFLIREAVREIDEYLPSATLEAEGLMGLSQAMYEIHFPTSLETAKKAKERLAFDELFALQLNALSRKAQYQRSARGLSHAMPLDSEAVKHFLSLLPYTLTDGQKIVLYQALKDMEKPFPMLRLLQGDVGSGKTVVAAVLAYHVIRAGHQVALLVPTEVLAMQHYAGLKGLFEAEGIRIGLLTGSTPAWEKEEIYEGLGDRRSAIGYRPQAVSSQRNAQMQNEDFTVHGPQPVASRSRIGFLIGTHALLQDKVDFQDLGLAIIDEQHRFGVEQRKVLSSYGYPHVLHMTATPIPRTLALTAYGDQDISVLAEMPSGRAAIITKVLPPQDRQKAYALIASEVEKGRQAYVLCPLVNVSEKLEAKAATEEYKNLQESSLGRYRIACLHGQMKSEEKKAVMAAFAAGETDILVTTSVIEVGISVQNATLMMIEGADRFGLAQLHQLRGRVGRGSQQSYCLLMSETQSDTSLERLRVLEETMSGFDIAEKDLEFRGAGELYGYRQSGMEDLRLANILDTALIERARNAAQRILEEDPELAESPSLKGLLKSEEEVVIG